MSRLDHVVFVILRRSPTASSLAQLRNDLLVAHHACGRKLVYLAVIPADAETLPEETRPLIASFSRFASSICESTHLVIQASGFRGTIMRSAITAVGFLTRERTLFVYGSLDEALGVVRRTLPWDRADALDEMISSTRQAA